MHDNPFLLPDPKAPDVRERIAELCEVLEQPMSPADARRWCLLALDLGMDPQLIVHPDGRASLFYRCDGPKGARMATPNDTAPIHTALREMGRTYEATER